MTTNFFTRLFSTRSRKSEERSSNASRPRLGAYPLLSESGSTPASALAIPTVYCCTQLIAEGIASLPLYYMSRNKEGIFTTLHESPLNYLFSVQPNPLTSAFDFWSFAVQQMLLAGNAYIVPIYLSGQIDSLVLCSPGSVSHDTLGQKYTISDMVNGLSGTYDEDEVIHLKNLTLDGRTGLSVLSFARLTNSVAASGNTETLERFQNGGSVRGLITNDSSVRGFGEYQDEELQKTAVDIDDRFRTGSRIVSLPGEVDFKQISLSSTDMQFLETRKFTNREICRFFRVPPSFVFDDTSNNYKSAEQASTVFLSQTLNPILAKIENELLRKLVSRAWVGKRKFQFDRQQLYATDLSARIAYQKASIESGLATINDCRKANNQRPVKGGDRVFISANLKPIDAPEFNNTKTVDND